jgi:hypothetical protein
MDIPSPRAGSATPNSGSGQQFERPLPPIPDPEPNPISWDIERAAHASRSSNPPHHQEHVDMSGIYDEDVGAEGQGINLHGVDGSLDIYPSRSSSSLSVNTPKPLTGSPYLEGISNSSTRPFLVIDDHSTSSPELLRSPLRERTGAASNSGTISLREFLGDAPSTTRNSSAVLAEASGLSSRSAVGASSPTGDSALRSSEPQGHPLAAGWQQSESRSNASLSVRTPTRRVRSGLDDDSSSSGSSGTSPLLSHTSSSQIRRRQQSSPHAEFVVPRWQPDAEVTFCPICRTQFSKLLDCDSHSRVLTNLNRLLCS